MEGEQEVVDSGLPGRCSCRQRSAAWRRHLPRHGLDRCQQRVTGVVLLEGVSQNVASRGVGCLERSRAGGSCTQPSRGAGALCRQRDAGDCRQQQRPLCALPSCLPQPRQPPSAVPVGKQAQGVISARGRSPRFPAHAQEGGNGTLPQAALHGWQGKGRLHREQQRLQSLK